jgi:membrane protein YdbS with pleckstrin-like domain
MNALSLAVTFTSVVAALAINEFSDVSPWLACRLVRLAAALRYGDTPRGRVRAEEHAAMMAEPGRFPGKLLKLVTALGFVATAAGRRTWTSLVGHSRPVPPLAGHPHPSAAIARVLYSTERFRGEWRRHWIHPVKQLSLLAGVATSAVYAAHRFLPSGLAAAAGICLLLTSGGLTILVVGAWWQGRFVLTDKRVVAVRGLLTRRVQMLPLMRVVDMTCRQSPLGRLLDYGTFRMESVGRIRPLGAVTNLPRPQWVYRYLVEEMYAPPDDTTTHADEHDDPSATLRQTLATFITDHAQPEQLAALATILALNGQPQTGNTPARAHA